MRSKTTIIVFVAIFALIAVTAVLMSIEREPRAAPPVGPGAERGTDSALQRPPVTLETPAREPARAVESPTPPPTAEVTVTPTPEIVENETLWAAQYADKS